MYRIPQKAKKYLKSFNEKQNITDWLSCFSICIWDKLEKRHKFGSKTNKFNEPTITENLVSDIEDLIREEKIFTSIRLFHSIKESTYGSDIEIILRLRKDRNIVFPCQAKRLYVEKVENVIDAKYETLNHNAGKQKVKLIEYAEKIKGFPLYLLYNYSNYDFYVNDKFPEKELYGCSLISAIYLAQNPPKSPTVPDLHGHALPLISILNLKRQSEINKLWGETPKHNAIYSTDKKIFGDKKWNEFLSPEYHETLSPTAATREYSKKTDFSNPSTFSPRFRIVFSHASY